MINWNTWECDLGSSHHLPEKCNPILHNINHTLGTKNMSTLKQKDCVEGRVEQGLPVLDISFKYNL